MSKQFATMIEGRTPVFVTETQGFFYARAGSLETAAWSIVDVVDNLLVIWKG